MPSPAARRSCFRIGFWSLPVAAFAWSWGHPIVAGVALVVALFAGYMSARKLTCPKCANSVIDLGANPTHCAKCGAAFSDIVVQVAPWPTPGPRADLSPEQRHRANLYAFLALASPFFFAIVTVGVLWILQVAAPTYYVSVGRVVAIVNAVLGMAGAATAAAMTPYPLGWRIASVAFWTTVAFTISGCLTFATIGIVGQSIGVTSPF